MSRILTALVLVPPLLAVLFLAPAWCFLLLAVAVSLLAAHELFGLAELRGYRPYRTTGYFGTALLTTCFYPGTVDGSWALFLLLLAIGAEALLRRKAESTILGGSAVTLWAAAYAGLLTGAVVGLRGTDADGRNWVFFLFAVIMFGDAGAYYTGSTLGRRRLAPTISPNKTVEGLIGGLIASVAVAAATGPRFLPHFGVFRASAVGLGLALLGVMGDLFESLLKRSSGVKDSSNLIPGHGGILDRIDSLLFGAPALLFYVRFLH